MTEAYKSDEKRSNFFFFKGIQIYMKDLESAESKETPNFQPS